MIKECKNHSYKVTKQCRSTNYLKKIKLHGTPGFMLLKMFVD